jgi:hypothetical protein
MDRFDERKPVHTEDEERAEHVRDEPMRQGDVLGLGGAAVPKAPGDPTTEYDPESVARRRERALGADEPSAERTAGSDRGKGATGIDMGYGGTGTDVSGE